MIQFIMTLTSYEWVRSYIQKQFFFQIVYTYPWLRGFLAQGLWIQHGLLFIGNVEGNFKNKSREN